MIIINKKTQEEVVVAYIFYYRVAAWADPGN